MDLFIFLIGAAGFGSGFILLLFFLISKRSLFVPFILMIVGVIFCFAGLILSSPLSEEERAVNFSLEEGL
ncbi:hypothetical protein [Alteribacillus sp. HJP-4]|uniref:hypothetical protein n=1 Tax=Alteribacillus sp. HJP-4 TaxID=2775394 RepID=UPI0035CCD6E5